MWPRLVHFPDWTHPNVSTYWQDQIAAFHSEVRVWCWLCCAARAQRNPLTIPMPHDGQVAFDGLWTDMNEVANFCDGRCPLLPDDAGGDLFSCTCGPSAPEASSLNTPPFLPGGLDARPCRSQAVRDAGGGLDCGTISMTARYHNDVLEYNRHNLFGHRWVPFLATHCALPSLTGRVPAAYACRHVMRVRACSEAALTATALTAVRGKRPFVLTRSTYSGSGSHVAHWLGEDAWGRGVALLHHFGSRL